MNKLKKWLDQVGYNDISELLVNSIDRNESIKETIRYNNELYNINEDIELITDLIIDKLYNLY